MTQQPIRFDDGAAYERMMRAWSQLVGQVFLDWLSPATGQRRQRSHRADPDGNARPPEPPQSTQHGHWPVHRTIPEADVRHHLARAVSRLLPAKDPSLWLRLWRAQVQKVRNLDQPQYRPDDRRDGERLLVMLDM